MRSVPFTDGPLEGAALDLWEPLPAKLALDLPQRWGGPGIACYELQEPDDEPSYSFLGWGCGGVTGPS